MLKADLFCSFRANSASLYSHTIKAFSRPKLSEGTRKPIAPGLQTRKSVTRASQKAFSGKAELCELVSSQAGAWKLEV